MALHNSVFEGVVDYNYRGLTKCPLVRYVSFLRELF